MDTSLHDELAEMGVAHWWYRGRRTVLRAVLDTHLPVIADRCILEVGAGTGSVTVLLVEYGNVTGVEPHAGAMQACRQATPAAMLIAGGVDDLATLPGQADVTFDVVGAFDVIEHIADDITALRTMRDRLAEDGRLVITVPALQMLWGKHDVVNGHFRRYSKRLLVARLRAAGFDPVSVSYFNTILFPGVAAVRLLRRLLPGEEKTPTSDFTMPPAPINRFLTALFGLEARIIRRCPLPLGSSIVAVATRA